MHYLIDSIEYPKDMWTTLDKVLGKGNEDPSSYATALFDSNASSFNQEANFEEPFFYVS